MITKTDLAKYENTWNKLPHVVSLGAQKNFVRYAELVCDRFDAHPTEYNDRWFQHLVAKAIVFSATEDLVSAADWYTNAYRANIVTYAIARVIQLIEEEFPGRMLDLDAIWKLQRVPEALSAQLESAAQVVHRILVAPPQEGANVTEWAKRQGCWERVLACEVGVVPDVKKCLRPASEEREDRRTARKEAREDGEISAQIEVVKLAQAGYWKRAMDWPRVRKILLPVEYGNLETAARRGVGYAPSEAQAKCLMIVFKKLSDDGFR